MKRVDFDPERRAQPAEPRHLRLRAHQLGRSARHRRRRDQAREARPRPRRDHERQRLAPHLGRARLLAQRPHPLLQLDRLDADRAQSRQLGGLVLGRRAPLGPERAQRRRRDLRHRRGLPQGRRDGRLLVQRPGGDQRRLRRARRHRPPAVAQGARHPDASTSTRTTTTPRACWAASGSRRGPAPTAPWRSPSPTSGSPKSLYDKDYVAERTTGFDEWKAYVLGEDDGVAQDARSGRRPRPACRPRTCARWPASGARKKTYLAAGGLHRLRRRLPRRHRHRLGARHGLPHGHAGPGQARRQHGLPAAGHAARHQLLSSRATPRAAISGDLDGTGARAQHVPAHAAARHDEHGQAGCAAPARSPRRSSTATAEGYPTDSSDRGPVPALRAIRRRATRRQDVLQVRRLPLRHDDRHQPLRAHVPRPTSWSSWSTSPSGSRARPSSPTSSCRPAPTSSAGTSASSPTAAATSSTASRSQPPRRRDAAQVHRAAGRVEVRLPDLPRPGHAPRAGRDVLRGRQRARLVQAPVRRHRPAARHLLEGVPQEGLLRGPAAAGGPARPGLVPLVRRGPRQGHAGAHAAAGRLHGGVRQGPADPVGQARVRVVEPQALRPRRPGARADHALHPGLGGPARRELYDEVPAAAHHAAPAATASTRRATARTAVVNDIEDHRVLDRRPLLLDRAHQPGRRRARGASASTTWCASSTTAAP